MMSSSGGRRALLRADSADGADDYPAGGAGGATDDPSVAEVYRPDRPQGRDRGPHSYSEEEGEDGSEDGSAGATRGQRLHGQRVNTNADYEGVKREIHIMTLLSEYLGIFLGFIALLVGACAIRITLTAKNPNIGCGMGLDEVHVD